MSALTKNSARHWLVKASPVLESASTSSRDLTLLAGLLDAHILRSLESGGADAALVRVVGRILSTQGGGTRYTPHVTRLPVLGCQVAGGDPELAIDVAAAWKALYVASKLYDDLGDGDAEREVGKGRTAVYLYTGMCLQSAAPLCLSELSADQYARAVSLITATTVRMVGGQYREHAGGEGETAEECLATVGDKAGSFWRLGAELGADRAAPDWPGREDLATAAFHGGVAVQLNDDLVGFRRRGPRGDLTHGRHKLPVVYALAVATGDDAARLPDLLARGADGDREAEDGARALATRLGAQNFMSFLIGREHRKVQDALARLAAPAPLLAQLSALLTDKAIA